MESSWDSGLPGRALPEVTFDGGAPVKGEGAKNGPHVPRWERRWIHEGSANETRRAESLDWLLG